MINPSVVSRRGALTIIAGAAAMSVPGSGHARDVRLFEWRGTALGSDARIALYHSDRDRADAAIAASLAEIERLENQFSLYRPNSALGQLNRFGVLERPSLDMVWLLAESRRFSILSGGAFDVTVQPLWQLYAEHFAAHPGDTDGPAEARIAQARALVNQRNILISPERIVLKPGMAATLNGIAQGYITDRIADLLRARGWSNILIDLGETRALDDHPDGRPWSIAIRDPKRPGQFLTRLSLHDKAVATSAGAATAFDGSGRYHHLFAPKTGRSACAYKAVTVVADRAVTADALSTAVFTIPQPELAAGLVRRSRAKAWLFRNDGGVAVLES